VLVKGSLLEYLVDPGRNQASGNKPFNIPSDKTRNHIDVHPPCSAIHIPIPSLSSTKVSIRASAVECIGGVLQSILDRNDNVAKIMQIGCQFQRIGGFVEKSCGNWGGQ
jgi:hypothetical protein